MNLKSIRHSKGRGQSCISILDPIEVQRQLRVGRVVMDDCCAQRDLDRIYQNYARAYTVRFEGVCCRFENDVMLFNNYIVVQGNDIIVDNLVYSYKLESGSLPRAIPNVDSHLASIASIASIGTPSVIQDTEEVPILVCNNEGGETWGHWVIQNLPKALLFNRLCPEGKIALPSGYFRCAWGSNFSRLLALAGIPDSAILQTDRNHVYRLKQVAFIDNLYSDSGCHPVVIDLLSNICNRVGNDKMSPTPMGGSNIFIERSNQTREIGNVQDIAAMLEQHQFSTLQMGNVSPDMQIQAWRNSRSILTTLGSDLTNVVFAEPGACVMILAPEWFEDCFFRDLFAAKGIYWNELRCGKLLVERSPKHLSSYWVDRDQLLAWLSRTLHSVPG